MAGRQIPDTRSSVLSPIVSEVRQLASRCYHPPTQSKEIRLAIQEGAMPSQSRPKETPPPRRKACFNCSRAKQRCDQQTGSCTRCRDRGIECNYSARAGSSRRSTSRLEPSTRLLIAADENVHPNGSANREYQSSSLYAPSDNHDTSSIHVDSEAPPQFLNGSLSTTDLGRSKQTRTSSTDDELVCTIDSSAIQNRWLNAFITDPQLRPKVPPAATNIFVGRMLKAYTASIIRHAHLPPFVHPNQLEQKSEASPLQNCIGLLKICSGDIHQLGDMPIHLIQGEMTKLFASRTSLSPHMLLATYQAYLIYIMTLYFHLEQQYSPLLRQYMMDLQQLACEICSQGTVCSAELKHTRPRWSSWVHTESKRRTLYLMYLFDNLLSSKDGTPVYVGTELRGLPAPASRHVWRATSQAEWQTAYNLHLSDWNDGVLKIDELWRPNHGTSVESLTQRQHRIDKWLESADEYCTMLFAVTSSTHGE